MIDIDACTGLFGIFGNPVGHSMSPILFNRIFQEEGINAVYLAFQVSEIGKAVAAFRALGMSGASVTIPYKETILPFLDRVEKQAAIIGAVNTLVWEDDLLIGRNSDAEGAVCALRDHVDIVGRRVAIIGAGGAARAAGFGIAGAGGRLVIVNRSKERGERLAKDLNADFLPLADVRRLHCDILIQATSIGMFPRVAESPVPFEMLQPGMVVMDMVYNPQKTCLLAEAHSRGCTAISGISMFAYQAALQLEWWTGKKPPLEFLRHVVTERMRG
jgi:shikimate dehydrogenase